MSKWTYYVHRSTDGEPIGQLDLSDVSIEDVLSGTSTLQASMSTDDPRSSKAFTSPWKYEITAVRDSVIGFHGPIVLREPSKAQRTVSISAASPNAYFYKRCTETDRNETDDQFFHVRRLVADAVAKTGGTIYRHHVSTEDSGVTKTLKVGGPDRRRVSDVYDELAQDPDTGFDYRWDATWYDETNHLVDRTLTLGYPEIGRDLSTTQMMEATIDLVDMSDREDGMPVANRVHMMGTGSGSTRKKAIAYNPPSVAAGYPLLEEVVDRSDVSDQTRLNTLAAHVRMALRPGSRGFTSTHSISTHFPYGTVDIGDRVGVNLTLGQDTVSTVLRVPVIRTDPQLDQVTFVYFDPTAAE